MDLNFNIENQTLKLEKPKPLANKSHDYLKLNFNFKTEDWQDKKTYCILRDSQRKNYLFEINDGVLVPSCVVQSREFHVTCYGTGDDGVRITTNILKIRLVESGFTGDISSVSGDVDVVQDLYDLIQNLDESISDVGKSGSYLDLLDVPEIFTPSEHSHSTSDITNFKEKTASEIKYSYRQLAN
uniref:hypothetical protein n=1 Tax=Methanobrevibacter sp. TaxID=66852 RepID=UPI00388FE4D0